nr:ATP-binding cassette domain-containing protein [Paenibacillus macerans]
MVCWLYCTVLFLINKLANLQECPSQRLYFLNIILIITFSFKTLAHISKKNIGSSSGEKQKVALASARMSDPAVLVMDEPSADLDMAATKQLDLWELRDRH